MSKARSPRDVCSTTIGTRGLIRCDSLAAGCPDLLVAGRSFLLLLLLRRPKLLARLRELGLDARHLPGDVVERLAQAQVLLEAVERLGRLQHPLDRLLLLALRLERLAHLRVAHLETEIVGDRLEHDLLADRARRLAAHPQLQLLRGLPRQLHVGAGVDPALLERARESADQLARTRLDERP